MKALHEESSVFSLFSSSWFDFQSNSNWTRWSQELSFQVPEIQLKCNHLDIIDKLEFIFIYYILSWANCFF